MRSARASAPGATTPLEAEATTLRVEMEALEKQAAAADEAIPRLLEVLPNVLDPDVPDGPDESTNVVLAQHGEPRDLGFEPKPHWDLGEALGMMDFAAAAKLAGARFTVLRGCWRGWNGLWGSSCSICTPGRMVTPRWSFRRW